MNFKKLTAYITAGALSVTALFSFSACRNSDDKDPGYNYTFKTVLKGSPATLDPQTAQNDCSVQIIPSLFQGLYRYADGGAVVPAMAEEVTVSDDGLEWTFRIKENVKWYGKEDYSADCTAEDFVYGFRRLMNPALRAPRAKEYYFIKNAEEINTGKITDFSRLGVQAHGKYELKITLTEPRSDIMTMLAEPPAMPCNAGYYEYTEGQYGLVADCVGSNGDFYISRWHYDKWTKDGNFIELKRNELNSENSFTAPRGVTYLINADSYDNFIKDETHTYCTSDAGKIQELTGKYQYDTYSVGVWGMIFNTGGIFGSKDLRTALGGHLICEGDGKVYTSADMIVPDGVHFGEGDYRMLGGYPSVQEYSEAELSERCDRALSSVEEGSLSGLRIILPEGTGLKDLLGDTLQKWQKYYGIYCMISELPYDSYLDALNSGDFSIAMLRIGGGGKGALSYIDRFSSGSPLNYSGISNPKFDDMINNALSTKELQTAVKYCIEAEQFILDNFWFVPLCFETEYVFSQKGVKGTEYDPFSGTFMYKNAVRK